MLTMTVRWDPEAGRWWHGDATSGGYLERLDDALELCYEHAIDPCGVTVTDLRGTTADLWSLLRACVDCHRHPCRCREWERPEPGDAD